MHSILLGVWFLAAASQETPSTKAPPAPPPMLAEYQLGLLRRGPRWTPEKTAETQAIQAAHMAHLGAMAASGRLVGAGPIPGGDELRGLLIFSGASTQEALTLAEADPAVKAGRLAVEVHPWWGPRAIGTAYAARVKADPAYQAPMKTYYFGLIRRGPKWTAERTPEVEKLQDAHMANIRALGEAGTMAAAGPFTDDGDLRGVFVFRAESLEAARALADGDPAVKAGRLVVDLHPWAVAEGVLP